MLLNSFVIGRGMVLMPKWDAGEALRLIEKEKVTYFIGVPTMSLELMTHPDRDKYDLSSLTDIAAGGAARPVSHVERLQKEFPHSQPALGYGLTETNAVGCGNYWGNYSGWDQNGDGQGDQKQDGPLAKSINPGSSQSMGRIPPHRYRKNASECEKPPMCIVRMPEWVQPYGEPSGCSGEGQVSHQHQ